MARYLAIRRSVDLQTATTTFLLVTRRTAKRTLYYIDHDKTSYCVSHIVGLHGASEFYLVGTFVVWFIQTLSL